MKIYELVKEIELYGTRVYEKELDKYSKVFAYQYNSEVFIISKYRGETVSLMRAPSIYIELWVLRNFII